MLLSIPGNGGYLFENLRMESQRMTNFFRYISSGRNSRDPCRSSENRRERKKDWNKKCFEEEVTCVLVEISEKSRECEN
jgi:hypothetical protein